MLTDSWVLLVLRHRCVRYLNVASAKVQPGPLLPGQVSVTQEKYEAVALAQYTQLLTQYGDMAEVWFDGGMSNIPGFGELISSAQPRAGYFNGQVTEPPNNVVRSRASDDPQTVRC